MIVTIDGPAGSGKSTVARKLAGRLRLAYLDTGAMYRALAYHLLQENVAPDDSPAVVEAARGLDMSVDGSPGGTRVRVDGRDVSQAIRSAAVTGIASTIALAPSVRDLMIQRQRAIGASLGSFVTEGRDQGSIVFPRADVKFVLQAMPQQRAQRRWDELRATGDDITLEEVLADVERRDARDAVQWAPLLKPGAATLVDTTRMTVTEVVEFLEVQVREQCADPPTSG